jgi:hypothetical protein
MSKTSRSRNQSKIIPFPKHLLIYQKPVSPFAKTKESKSISTTRYSNDGKSVGPVVRRGKTLTDENYNDEEMACLVKVERNYVQEMLNSPTKYKSKSPIQSKRGSNSSPIKAQHLSNKFENLTTCDFLYMTNARKVRRNKISITPSPFLKKSRVH